MLTLLILCACASQPTPAGDTRSAEAEATAIPQVAESPTPPAGGDSSPNGDPTKAPKDATTPETPVAQGRRYDEASLTRPASVHRSGDAVLEEVPVTASPEATGKAAAAEASTLAKSVDWILRRREEVAREITDLAVSADDFFASEVSRRDNKSYLLVRGGAIWSKGGEIGSDSDVKLKLDMPGTKKRWKVLFESDPDELNDLDSAALVTPQERRDVSDTSGAAGAVRFVIDNKSRWKQDFDLGVRGSTPLDPFSRYEIRRNEQINALWSYYFRESVYVFREDGWGQRTTFLLERPLRPDYLWRNRIDSKFRDTDNVLETVLSTSTVHFLDPLRAMFYSVGLIAVNRPNSQVSEYFINTTYRVRLYKDWLFFDIRPELAFPRDDEFKPNPSLTFGLDVYFWD